VIDEFIEIPWGANGAGNPTATLLSSVMDPTPETTEVLFESSAAFIAAIQAAIDGDTPLDLAITGDGFFKIQTDHGIRYTRNGNFGLNAEGTLVTGEGDVVLGENGPITIDEDGEVITINDAGEVDVDETVIGTLKIVSFDAPEQLTKEGNSLFYYSGPESDEITPDYFEVRQGHLEQSNVEMIREMTNMVTINRQYETFQKLIQTIDELDTKATSEIGKIA
jgi:flagellar basal-body rod protein FlgG